MTQIQEEQLKFLIDSQLRERLNGVFDAQGLTTKEGMKRLVEFLVDQPAELHPLILRQLPGRSVEYVANAVLVNLKRKGENIPPAVPRSGGSRKHSET